MRFPTNQGVIRRRLLINYRADAHVVRKLLPAGMEPALNEGYAIVGICLIRLESIVPVGLPRWFPGLASENAAHRIAVVCDRQKAVFIPRRDTSSRLNHLVGGRLFPGEHGLATFDVHQENDACRIAVQSKDNEITIGVSGHVVDHWPEDSCLPDLETASDFFREASLGYSVTCQTGSYDGVVLDLPNWSVRPFEIDRLASTYFEDTTKFPNGSLLLDHALFMQDQEHRWLAVPSWQETSPSG